MGCLYELISNKKVINIQKFADRFAKLIDKDLKVKCGLFNQSDIYTNTVYLGLARYTKQQESDVEFTTACHIASDFDYVNWCKPQTFAFFHEIGHIIMAKFYNDKTFEHRKYSLQVDYIVNAWEMGEISSAERNMFYNKISMENDANSWAMLFIEQNLEMVKVYETVMSQLVSDLFPNG